AAPANSEAANVGTFIGPPIAPTTVNATDGKYLEYVTISWDASPGADEYKIFRWNKILKKWRKIGTTAITNFDDTAAKPLTIYKYKVKACNIAGCTPGANTDTGYRAKLVKVNVVKNSGFEKDANQDGIPNAWQRETNDGKDKRVCKPIAAHLGNCGFRFTGDNYGPADDLWQNLTARTLNKGGGNIGDILKLIFWAKTKNLASPSYASLWVTDTGTALNQHDQVYLPYGDSGWTQYTLELTITLDSYDDVIIELYFQGGETEIVFFDDVKVILSYVDTTP
ncbi:MAG: fibronectin type III domain-containing protein, partial [Anaerolineae bacterium]|nr:fibronectin type III domain-containing protein [Anaerolineae bacterium]